MNFEIVLHTFAAILQQHQLILATDKLHFLCVRQIFCLLSHLTLLLEELDKTVELLVEMSDALLKNVKLVVLTLQLFL